MEWIGKRISVVRRDDELSIVISSAENKRQAFYWLIWSLLWTSCGIIVLVQYLQEVDADRKIFLLVFLGFWIYFQYKSVYLLCWKWKGREFIKIRKDILLVGKRIFGKGKALRFGWEGVRDFKKVEQPASSALNVLKSIDIFTTQNKLSLLYFGKEYSFGNELSGEDTRELFSLLKREIRKFKKD